MKKLLILFICLFLLTACTNKKEEKEIVSEKKMLTCTDRHITYYYYFNNDTDSYYMAKYLMEYEFKTEREARDLYNIKANEWDNNYQNSNMEMDLKIDGSVLTVTITSYEDSNYENYKEFFGDRYNLNLKELNSTFNDKCLIKPI